jgi:hypothetical protein
MADVVSQGKVLLVNLGGLAQETASLTGTLIMNALWHAVKTSPAEKPVYLYMHEFQKFVRLPIDPESMLAEARGFGLGMTLAVAAAAGGTRKCPHQAGVPDHRR